MTETLAEKTPAKAGGPSLQAAGAGLLVAVVTFLGTASGVSFFGIGSAFWGLVAGLAILLLTRWQPRLGR